MAKKDIYVFSDYIRQFSKAKVAEKLGDTEYRIAKIVKEMALLYKALMLSQEKKEILGDRLKEL